MGAVWYWAGKWREPQKFQLACRLLSARLLIVHGEVAPDLLQEWTDEPESLEVGLLLDDEEECKRSMRLRSGRDNQTLRVSTQAIQGDGVESRAES